jgi:uncharacterized protein (DUF697 family)
MSTNNSIHIIIHVAATAAAAAGAGMAQVPGSDNFVITPIQVSMIMAIGEFNGQQMSKSVALSTLSAASAGITGRTVAQFLVGWIPGWGNAMNATTAFSVTEAIGWAAHNILSEKKECCQFS